jgi:hypothetical protein
MANKQNEINRFKKDLKSFGLSAAGNLPGVGSVLGIYDTYSKGKQLAKSSRRLYKTIKRRYL